ncbi:MAG TPA: hypothetical protein VLI46_00055 [Ramlibacter sp.]|nr:hypothetical protein [Ramlibacter sp.]
MNRLQAELHRLHLAREPQPSAGGDASAMVLELARPAHWQTLSKAWQGVQADLGLPAPAIAISGTDAYQLWFSLAEPAPAAQASAFLDALRRHYLAGVMPDRIRRVPCDGSAPNQLLPVLPPIEALPGQWSAFVAPDLATLFEAEPWLDLAPSPDAQADLLSRLVSIQPGDLARALERLRAIETPPPPSTTPAQAHRLAAPSQESDPRQFLLDVMNDRSIDLHLRIEAAKALLPYFANTP